MTTLIDRRAFLQLGALVAAAVGGGGGASRASPATLNVMRVCNTGYYPAAARLHTLAPGTPLEVRFDYDPAWVNRASAGFFLNGEKVGDAPRLQREMFGRMLLDGRRLDAVIDHVRLPTEYDDTHAVRAAVRLDRDASVRPIGLDADKPWSQAHAESFEAERFVRLVGEAAGAPPTYLTTLGLYRIVDADAFVGEPLRALPTVSDSWPALRLETLSGIAVGTDFTREGSVLAGMVEGGVVLGGVVLPPLGRNSYAFVAIYLIG